MVTMICNIIKINKINIIDTDESRSDSMGMVFEINENYVPDDEPAVSEWAENTEEEADKDE